MKFHRFLIILLILQIKNIQCLDFFNPILKHTVCKVRECCHRAVIPHKIENLASELNLLLFGQHIVEKQVYKAIYSHYETIEKSKKPLVMSFHGTPGVGKNYVAEIIARSLYEKGLNSKFVHVYHGSMQFLRIEKIEENKEMLAVEILDAIRKCPYSLFIFDEVDKMLPGIFDAITSLLDYHGFVDGVDIRKSIFIFIGNTAGREIASTYESIIREHGLYREETKLHHFEEIAKIGAFNVAGGLQNSNTIAQSVIDHYMPFLPLERKHVEDCIRAEFKKYVKYPVDQEIVDKIIARFVVFEKNKIFSLFGCKNLDKKVVMEAEELLGDQWRIEEHSEL